MSTWRALIDPAGRSLAYHVSRLQAKLDDLRERLRETAARLLGETMAAVVEQTVRDLLTMPAATLPPPVHSSRDYRREPPWADPDSADDLYDPHEPYGGYRHRESDAYHPERDAESEPETPRVSHWRQALAIGLRAAAWWLQRWTGRSSLGVALGVGLTATAVVLAGGPLTAAGAGVVASALGLAGLVALMQSGAALLAVPGVT